MFKIAKSQKAKGESWKYFRLLPFAYYLIPTALNAQCAMCRASLEGENNVAKAEAVNDGIVYLMIIPYILAAVLGIIIYRMYKNRT